MNRESGPGVGRRQGGMRNSRRVGFSLHPFPSKPIFCYSAPYFLRAERENEQRGAGLKPTRCWAGCSYLNNNQQSTEVGRDESSSRFMEE